MFAISPTDLNWFSLLKAMGLNSEVNFWTPTPWNVTKLTVGEKLYFMLKSPIRKIGGCGEFIEYKNMTVDTAWNKFGYRNGCSSKAEFIGRLDQYKNKRSTDNKGVLKSEIGCILLNNVEFWDEEDFIDLSNYNIDFSRYIVKMKYFYGDDVLRQYRNSSSKIFELVSPSTVKQKKTTITTARKGVGVFRAKVSKVYSNSCCISGDKTIELLEAAHIQPYLNEYSNHVCNGLLLRIDFHKMYDNGLLYIDENYEIHISPEVKSAYYHTFNGKTIFLPTHQKYLPSKGALLTKKFEFRNG